jgi:peptide/nickel transport system substrate-binding protein
MSFSRTLAGLAALPAFILAAQPAAADTVEVVYGVYSDSEGLDPHVGSGGFADHIVTIAVFDPLIWDFDAAQPDGQRRGLRPMLAESWEIVDDLTWRLRLRQGVVFHNGAPFNAEAVKFSLERPHQPDFETGDKIIDVAIERVEIIDDYTVDVITSEPIPILPERLTRNGAFILEPGHYAGLGQDEAARQPVGTGPFKLVEWDRDRRIVLERNEDYWGRQPSFDRLVFKVVPEASTMLVEALTGEVDIAPINPDVVDQVEAAEGVRVVAGDSLLRAMIGINIEAHEALGDARVREAINWAIDTDALIDAYALGLATPSLTMVSPPYEHPDLEPFGYDPARAKELLAEAGWADGFAITMDVGHPDAFGWAEAVAFFLGEVGIEVSEVNLLSRSVWVERWSGRTLAGLHPYHWSAGENTPETDMWAVHPGRPTNSTNWVHEEWIEAYDELTRTVDPQARDRLNRRLQEILHEENPWVDLFRMPIVKAVSERVEGYHPHPSFLVEDYTAIRVVE